jgi:hypothetical protein
MGNQRHCAKNDAFNVKMLVLKNDNFIFFWQNKDEPFHFGIQIPWQL